MNTLNDPGIGSSLTGGSNKPGNNSNGAVNSVMDLLFPHLGTQRIEQENLEMQKEQQQYERWLQQEIFRREDNATQRKTADLRAAGLSPIMAAGASSRAGSVVPSKAPQSGTQAMSQMIQLVGNIADVSRTFAEAKNINAQTKRTLQTTEHESKYLPEVLQQIKHGNEYAGKTLEYRIDKALSESGSAYQDSLIKMTQKNVANIELNRYKEFETWLTDEAKRLDLPEGKIKAISNPRIQEAILGELIVDAKRHNLDIAKELGMPVGQMQTSWEAMLLGQLQKLGLGGSMQSAIQELIRNK